MSSSLLLVPYLFIKADAGYSLPAGAPQPIPTTAVLLEVGVERGNFGVFVNEYVADTPQGTFSTTFAGVSYKFYWSLR